MSYKDLVYSGQLWAVEKMVEERPDDDRPELAEYRLSLVFFKKVLFYNFIFL
jgi:hypothetical protein